MESREGEFNPTKEHMEDPYVLQLIQALSAQQDTIEEQEAWQNEREGAEHYGPYGANCMNTGQFDAGECWLCAGKRKQEERDEVRKQLLEAEAQSTIEEFTLEAELAKDRYDAVWEQSERWEEAANANKRNAANMQLAAGRYQYMHEHAQKCINKIDDLFEYAYLDYQLPVLQRTVRGHLKAYTEAVAKVARAIPAQKSIEDTVKERIADPKTVDVDLKDL